MLNTSIKKNRLKNAKFLTVFEFLGFISFASNQSHETKVQIQSLVS